MMMPRMVRGRAFGARACLAAIALALLLVPGLHALVHIHEAEHREHAGHAHGEDGDHDHDHARDHHDHERAPGHHHHGGHHHSGDESPLEHGDGAPEHLGIALLESESTPVPRPGHPVDSLVPPAPIDRIAAAPRTRAHGSRAPPGDPASRNID